MIDKVIEKQKDNCSGCCACFNICNQNAVSMISDEEGFLYPCVDYSQCVYCGKCLKTCPTLKKTQRLEDKDYKDIAYAAYNKDLYVRKASSSGGVFSVLAEYVLKQDGTIYGAAFDEAWDVKHIRISKSNDLHRLRGSKYVQSNINTSYQNCKKDLLEGKMVLFSGTPCQIEGLKAYLQDDFKKLITIDIICYGVPSPLVWKSYVEGRTKSGSIKSINFRSKKCGWEDFSLEIQDFRCYKEEGYMAGFLSNLFLRPSCHNCKFKTLNRNSDFTIADFWGVKEVLPDFGDDLGISLILAQSDKAIEVLAGLKNQLNIIEVDRDKAIKYNTAAIESAAKNANRDLFFELFHKVGVEQALNTFVRHKSWRKKLSLSMRRWKKEIILRFKN